MDSDNDTYKMLTVLNGGGASTCTVTGLMKYQLYEFFIVPFYKTVEGKPSNSRMARTLEDGKFNYSVFCCFFFCSYFACLWQSDHFVPLNREKKTKFSGSMSENRMFYCLEMDMKPSGKCWNSNVLLVQTNCVKRICGNPFACPDSNVRTVYKINRQIMKSLLVHWFGLVP